PARHARYGSSSRARLRLDSRGAAGRQVLYRDCQPQVVSYTKAPKEKNMKTLVILLSIVFVGVAQDTSEIRNFLRVNKDFCTGGQPKLEHLEKLKAEGVKAIINLRQPSEHRAEEEAAKAKELGLRYFNIPVVYGNPNEAQVEEFLKITDDAENRPAFIHCTAAIRVGAFWMIRRVLRDGWKVEDAEAEAVKIGLREAPHWNEFARKYIETHRSKAALPTHPLKFGVCQARFEPAGTVTLEGGGWPKINGTWKASGSEVEFLMSGGPGGCDGPGKYRFDTDGQHITFHLVSDECKVRRLLLDGGRWIPTGEVVTKPPRNITTTSKARPSRATPATSKGSWPSFRG